MNIKPKSKGRCENLTIRMTKGEMRMLKNIVKQTRRTTTEAVCIAIEYYKINHVDKYCRPFA